LKMPQIDGITCARRVRERGPRRKVLTMTGMDPAPYTGAALEAGVSGLLQKPFDREKLTSAIHSVVAGRR